MCQLLSAPASHAFQLSDLWAPCEGDCAFATYAGTQVVDGLDAILLTDPTFPTNWTYDADDTFVGLTASRVAGTWRRIDFEPELGIGKRFGNQTEGEVWAALYFRYRGFPWDRWLTTSVALSTGLNYATDVSALETEKARDGQGNRMMHFFSPEITFALPAAPNSELLFRFHHRSGVFGLVSDAFGGSQYGTVGLRMRF